MPEPFKKRSVYDVLREKKGESQAKPAEPPKPAKAPEPKAPKAKAKVEPIRVDKVEASCGHQVDVKVFADDKHEAQRKAQTAAKACSPCRQARHAAEMAEAAKRKAERANRPKPATKSTNPKKGKKFEDRTRLPHGSYFEAVFDAEKVRWKGSLTIPVEGDPPTITFYVEATAVFKLMRGLDNMYRDYLATREKAENPIDLK